MTLPTIPRSSPPRRIVNSASPELYLYDTIGQGLFGGISSKDIVEQLKTWAAAGAPPVSVRINSPGGEVFEGFAIYNALVRYPGVVDSYIDGAAWSIASVIAMAGREVYMAENAEFMIHNPAALLFGEAEEFRRIADRLDATKDSLITAYQRHTSRGRQVLSEWMDQETWFGAEEAEAAGFITHIEEAVPVAAYCPPVMKFRNMPLAVQKRLRPSHGPGRVDVRAAMLHRVNQRLQGFSATERTVTLS